MTGILGSSWTCHGPSRYCLVLLGTEYSPLFVTTWSTKKGALKYLFFLRVYHDKPVKSSDQSCADELYLQTTNFHFWYWHRYTTLSVLTYTMYLSYTADTGTDQIFPLQLVIWGNIFKFWELNILKIAYHWHFLSLIPLPILPILILTVTLHFLAPILPIPKPGISVNASLILFLEPCIH